MDEKTKEIIKKLEDFQRELKMQVLPHYQREDKGKGRWEFNAFQSRFKPFIENTFIKESFQPALYIDENETMINNLIEYISNLTDGLQKGDNIPLK